MANASTVGGLLGRLQRLVREAQDELQMWDERVEDPGFEEALRKCKEGLEELESDLDAEGIQLDLSSAKETIEAAIDTVTDAFFRLEVAIGEAEDAIGEVESEAEMALEGLGLDEGEDLAQDGE
jgi:hypothetical protein